MNFSTDQSWLITIFLDTRSVYQMCLIDGIPHPNFSENSGQFLFDGGSENSVTTVLSKQTVLTPGCVVLGG